MSKLSELIAKLPSSPGVYLYQDRQGRIIYIGKAVDLKKRVSSYFVRTSDDAKTRLLVSKIKTFSTIVTHSETEALLLEDSLIKKHKPKYNIDLKDDKRFPYLRLAVKEPFPYLTIVRQRNRDGAKYFGPYAGSLQDTLKMINKLFRLRKCTTDLGKIKKPCLYFQLAQCLGPCQDQNTAAYRQEVKALTEFLQGNFSAVAKTLQDQMQVYSSAQQYEKAAEVRDKLAVLDRLSDRQTVVAPDLLMRDIWNFAENTSFLVAQVLIMQNGRIVGSKDFSAAQHENYENSYLERTILNYYQDQEFLPAEIILPAAANISQGLIAWLATKNIKAVWPASGFRHDLLRLAKKNVLKLLQDKMLNSLKQNKAAAGLQRLKAALALETLPARIDCFDISDLQGTDTVASLTVLTNGQPDKKEYRKYHIDQNTPNDFAAMEEVLTRRYYKVLTGEEPRPDLIIVDGGKGQLSMAKAVLKKFNLDIPVAGLAKKNEELFLPNRLNPVVLKRSDPGLQLVQKLRDEAHRFAVAFHQTKRRKRVFASALDDLPGLGPKAKEKLLQAFGSVDLIKQKSQAELLKVLNRKQAETVVKYFQRPS